MRNATAEQLYIEAVRNPNIYVVVADISPAGSMLKFREQYPDRFINVGVAEQSMIGVCAGLALRGKQPFAYTIASFALYRPFEFVRDDLAYQGLPVTVVGMGAGVIYADHGSTHHTMEDIAVAGAIPGMQIIAPCDPAEAKAAVKWCAKQRNGPVYLRIGKAGEPTLTDDPTADPWNFGQLRCLKMGTQPISVISYGVITEMAKTIADYFSGYLFVCHTLKPIDEDRIKRVLNFSKQVIVLEEHVPHGGLASRVKQIAWDNRVNCRLDTFTLQDKFIHNNGTHLDMLAAHGLSLDRILKSVSK